MFCGTANLILFLACSSFFCQNQRFCSYKIVLIKKERFNTLELKPILLSLVPVLNDHGIHVKVFSDSATAIACINKLGTSNIQNYANIL